MALTKVTTGGITDATIATADIAADAVTGAKIADDAINSEHYTDGSIDTAHIADSQITTAKIADTNVTTGKLANGAVDYGKLADGAVLTAKIADSNVTTAKIADDAVTLAKMAADTVSASQIINNAVTVNAIATDAVTTPKIADGQVTSAKLASGVGGKILQVVQTTKTDTFSTSSSSYTDVTGLSVAITPSSSSNKVLVMLDIKIGSAHEDAAYAGRLVRGSTAIYTGGSASNRTVASFGTSRQSGNAGYDVIQDRQAIFLDSPSTTSSTTYKVQVVCNNSRDTYVNRTHDDGDTVDTPRVASSITVMEVGA